MASLFGELSVGLFKELPEDWLKTTGVKVGTWLDGKISNRALKVVLGGLCGLAAYFLLPIILSFFKLPLVSSLPLTASLVGLSLSARGRIPVSAAPPISLRIADCLGACGKRTFQKWGLSRSVFAELSDAKPLDREMQIHRKNDMSKWWRFHFTKKCHCDGRSGNETDLLAMFESKTRLRFAMHFAVKQPTDKFKADGVQSRGYP